MNNNNIIISDYSSYEEKLKNIKKGGFEKLHFLADFDNTLTKKFGLNCKKCVAEMIKFYHVREIKLT